MAEKKEKVQLQGFEVEVDEINKVLSAEDGATPEVFEAESEAEATEDQTIPVYGSDEWNDYVMGLFKPEELINGNPLTPGLRRVAVQMLGPIVSSKPVNVFPSMDPNGPGRATVVYELIIDFGGTGDMRIFGDVGEVWHGNTDDLFCAHATATACTKAEGRCLRKALMVKCLAAEELPSNKDAAAAVRNAVKVETPTTGEMVPEDTISKAQIGFLEGKSRQLDVNLVKFINRSATQYKHINELTKQVASYMIQDLNKLQGEGDIPIELRGFDPKWRDSFTASE
jgi:hypothetical protein